MLGMLVCTITAQRTIVGVLYEFEVKPHEGQHKTAMGGVGEFVRELRDNLKERFPKVAMEVLSALDAFDVSALPDGESS